MRDFSLFLLKQIGKLTMADPRFRDFAGGVFSGVISQSAWLVPRALYHVFPKDAQTWLALLASNGKEVHGGAAAGTLHLLQGTLANAVSSGMSLARNPLVNLDWGLELAAKAASLAERRILAETTGARA
jgi:hypothetical protein